MNAQQRQCKACPWRKRTKPMRDKEAKELGLPVDLADGKERDLFDTLLPALGPEASVFALIEPESGVQPPTAAAVGADGDKEPVAAKKKVRVSS